MALIYSVDVLYYVRNLLLQSFFLFLSEPANKLAMAFKQSGFFVSRHKPSSTYLFVLQSQFIEKGFKETENVEHNVLLLLFGFNLLIFLFFWGGRGGGWGGGVSSRFFLPAWILGTSAVSTLPCIQ